ncbi:MAG TPA: hemin uptake protein HemP [Ottowia sp.]|nr:hemin uptake protein HemP [Ottowia sp.]
MSLPPVASPPGPTEPGPQAPTHAADPLTALDSARLLAGRPSVNILHNGAVYRLQATRTGKLILTK